MFLPRQRYVASAVDVGFFVLQSGTKRSGMGWRNIYRKMPV